MDIQESNIYNDNESFDYKFRRLQEDRSDFSKKCNIVSYQTNGDNEIIQTNFSNQMLKSHLCSNKLSQHFWFLIKLLRLHKMNKDHQCTL